ncbi:hypothetical protein [Hymenobacter metallicola]|uniref:DUF4279 domain-containing protein n=1 Tax=Hymenobacter metallicola TaxID=2563114 RepID=A0A4Z0QHK1_9BACT|nr:hypothetical protein [Hymenobacter metallicola]TGE28956.1 hypothetical protein E5K02_05700 [Hymenobacter metallicola]
MKYHQLFIDCNSPETYAAVTLLLGVEPLVNRPSKWSPNVNETWHFQVETSDQDPPFDFINTFLDLLEGNYDALAALGIQRTNILFWLVYEYDQQCAMEFYPLEMERLGKNGIHLNIDCYPTKTHA